MMSEQLNGLVADEQFPGLLYPVYSYWSKANSGGGFRVCEVKIKAQDQEGVRRLARMGFLATLDDIFDSAGQPGGVSISYHFMVGALQNPRLMGDGRALVALGRRFNNLMFVRLLMTPGLVIPETFFRFAFNRFLEVHDEWVRMGVLRPMDAFNQHAFELSLFAASEHLTEREARVLLASGSPMVLEAVSQNVALPDSFRVMVGLGEVVPV